MTQTPWPQSILIVDDFPAQCLGTQTALQNLGFKGQIHCASNGNDALSLMQVANPEVVLMDCSMPVMDGITCTRKIISKFPKTKVIAYSAASDGHTISAMLNAGASGYIIKSNPLQMFTEAITSVMLGNLFCCPVSNQFVLKRAVEKLNQPPAINNDNLTTRQLEVLNLYCRDFEYSEIADALNISTHTASEHMENIRKIIGLKGRIAIYKYATQNNLIAVW